MVQVTIKIIYLKDTKVMTNLLKKYKSYDKSIKLLYMMLKNWIPTFPLVFSLKKKTYL